METVGVSELRNNLLSLIKKVQSGENILITSRGHGVAKLVPLENSTEEAVKALKELRKSAYVGDVLSPVDEEWESMK